MCGACCGASCSRAACWASGSHLRQMLRKWPLTCQATATRRWGFPLTCGIHMAWRCSASRQCARIACCPRENAWPRHCLEHVLVAARMHTPSRRMLKHVMQVKDNERQIREEIEREEAKFLKTIAAGQGELKKHMDKAKASNAPISGAAAFQMYDSHGFPLELTKEVAESEGLTVDQEGFDEAMQEQRQRSKVRALWATCACNCLGCCCLPAQVQHHKLLHAFAAHMNVTGRPPALLHGAMILVFRSERARRGGHDSRCRPR